MLTCGEGGSTGADIVGQINDNTAAIVVIGEAPAKTVVRLDAHIVQTISDEVEPKPLTCADVIAYQIGGFEATIVGNVPTLINTGGALTIASVAIGLNVDIDALGGQLDVCIYRSTDNGANWLPCADTPVSIQGLGAGKPLSFYWESDIAIAAGEMFQLRGRNGDNGSFDCTFMRTSFRLFV